ncbi:MAG: FAD-binding domain-containing protein, partial [Leifsonia sp.]|nr:FAD-binding domain-containing protein [Leifsonia sp.]
LDPAARRNAPAFLRELGWREFAWNVLFHWPELATTNLRPEYDAFPWTEPSPSDLRAWQFGRTGIPLVDAGMRELWATGVMHNRVRMVAASFLIKNLLIDWRVGEQWFWDTLVDADEASNPFNWQWVAGSGADAAPYFRVFNPELQAAKFDPRGEYLDRWVPERLTPDYPDPIVDLARSRRDALAADQDAGLSGAHRVVVGHPGVQEAGRHRVTGSGRIDDPGLRNRHADRLRAAFRDEHVVRPLGDDRQAVAIAHRLGDTLGLGLVAEQLRLMHVGDDDVHALDRRLEAGGAEVGDEASGARVERDHRPGGVRAVDEVAHAGGAGAVDQGVPGEVEHGRLVEQLVRQVRSAEGPVGAPLGEHGAVLAFDEDHDRAGREPGSRGQVRGDALSLQLLHVIVQVGDADTPHEVDLSAQ